MADVLCAGHICLDLIPSLTGGFAYEPGKLVEVGAATVSTGGSVSNTGLSLHRLGASIELCGRVGDDAFGRLVVEVLRREGVEKPITLTPGAETSYTVVLNPPNQDRMFLHCPGANTEFGSEDVTAEMLKSSRILHLGYPPLLRRMALDDGEEVRELFVRAHEFGALTSLDMTFPDPDSESGHVDWKKWLANVLPYCDLFVPSAPELAFMLGTDDLLAEQALALGASVVLLKNGEAGLSVAASTSLRHPLLPTSWAGQTHFESSFQVEVAGTTGAGDATVAGFLFALLKGLHLPESARIAAAVGACSVEKPDAVSGVPSWQKLQERLDAGLAKR